MRPPVLLVLAELGVLYRVELCYGRGKVETRRIHLGEAGADLRVP